jgi:hypothetical protein
MENKKEDIHGKILDDAIHIDVIDAGTGIRGRLTKGE